MEDEEKPTFREQDLYLPIANVGRTMKLAIPENGKISKESKELMQECMTEFIGFVTSEACDFKESDHRKLLNGDDILYAMKKLGFDYYIEPLSQYLNLSRQFLATKNSSNVKMTKFTNPDLSHVYCPLFPKTPLETSLPMSTSSSKNDLGNPDN